MITTVIRNLAEKRTLSYVPPNGREMSTDKEFRIPGIFDTSAYLALEPDIYDQLLYDLANNRVRIINDFTQANVIGTGGGRLTKEFKDLVPVPVVHGALVDTGIELTDLPSGGGWVGVFLNGVLDVLGDGVTTAPFYFSSDVTGVIAKQIEDIQEGDHLWTNPAELGFSLDATDRISLVFSIS